MDAEPAARRPHRALFAMGGAVLGAAAGLGGGFAWWRRRQGNPMAPDDASGRGLPETPPSPQAVRKGFETEDMSGSLMGLLALGLGLAIAVAIWLMVVMLQNFRADRDAAPPLTVQQRVVLPTPLPHVQSAPWDDIAAMQRQARQRLGTYDWADPGHVRARIPIAEAMRRSVGQSLDGETRVGSP